MNRVIVALALLLSGPATAHEALVSKAKGIDLTKLPVGDTRVSTTPKAGWIWACRSSPDTHPVMEKGPWFNADGDTYDLTRKAIVRGEVNWPQRFEIRVEAGKRVFASNDLPNHPTGEFPISPNDPAFQYDRNPSRISEQRIAVELPLDPVVAPQPNCVPGAVGILLTGVVLFNALDAAGLDAVAHEVQDGCQGHPQRDGVYHYHSLTICHEDKVLADGHSALMGYALDGFGIYGRFGEGGKPLKSADLDECHGHTHPIEWDGKTVNMYHYHGTWDFPYTIGCMRGQFSFEDVRKISGGPPTAERAGGPNRRPPPAGMRRNGHPAIGTPPNGPPANAGEFPVGAVARTEPGAGPRPGGRPNMAAAAAKLGITERQLIDAMGPPPPDIEGAARKLGISVETLRQALAQSR